MLKWQPVAAGYTFLGSLALGLAVGLRDDGNPFVHPAPWLALGRDARHGWSALLGVALAVVVIVSTRVAVHRWRWASGLHNELRPVAKDLTAASITVIAVFSGLGEEMFFRGLLAPLVGVIIQAVLFGLLHQVRGPSRWVWVAWTTIVGLALGAIFALTGSLVGPIAAHALVNGRNLAFLRDFDPRAKDRQLGGLLAHSDA
jgi:uncharacterized protein